MEKIKVGGFNRRRINSRSYVDSFLSGRAISSTPEKKISLERTVRELAVESSIKDRLDKSEGEVRDIRQ